MLAASTFGDAVRTVAIFLLLIGFVGVGIWLLIRLVQNTNFISGNRTLRIVVKVLLVVLTVFVPPVGVLVLFVIWYSTRSSTDATLEPAPSSAEEMSEEVQEPTTAPGPGGAPERSSLPFPPPSSPEDTEPAS